MKIPNHTVFVFLMQYSLWDTLSCVKKPQAEILIKVGNTERCVIHNLNLQLFRVMLPASDNRFNHYPRENIAPFSRN